MTPAGTRIAQRFALHRTDPPFKEAIMDVPATEEQIRSLAYSLWEEAGCPEGQAEAFWAKAEEQLGVESSDVKSDAAS
jgi:hypothetical protein